MIVNYTRLEIIGQYIFSTKQNKLKKKGENYAIQMFGMPMGI